MMVEGVTHTLQGEWDFEASIVGPAVGQRGAITHTLASMTFSEEGWGGERSWPPMVKSFQVVFPEELVELPPFRDVEFTIELIPGTGPISQAAYRMGPTKL